MQKATPKFWLNISLFNLCLVASLGVILRSKMVFNVPWIEYNRLVDTHGNFGFAGWVTLALLTLLLFELPGGLGDKKNYRRLLAAMLICTYANLVVSPTEKLHGWSQYISLVYIVFIYVFAWNFITDIIKSSAIKPVKLLSVAALLCLVLSSIGTLMLGYLFATKSLNAILYRDALFGYLHLQYNGFFTLSVFAIAFNKLAAKLTESAAKTIYHFSILLCCSVPPSMFITFLWHDTNIISHSISVLGSVLLFLTFIWFLLASRKLMHELFSLHPTIRAVIILSMGAFAIKLFLHGFTIIQSVNILIFGNRPLIMGFLHLVFLGFVTLFIVGYMAHIGFLNVHKLFTRVALIVFMVAIAANETLLMMQGMGTMFTINVLIFNWFLWVAGLLLSLSALLISVARRRYS